jgi:hypothetical protein
VAAILRILEMGVCGEGSDIGSISLISVHKRDPTAGESSRLALNCQQGDEY